MSTNELLPDIFQPIIERFNKVFQLFGKGSLTADMVEFSSDLTSRLTSETDKRPPVIPASHPPPNALRHWMAQQPGTSDLVPPNVVSYDKKVDIAGTTYHPRNIAWGDSFILVGTDTDWQPAQIRSIFSIQQPHGSRSEIVTLLSISRFRPLSPDDAFFDNYRTFSHVGGRIYYDAELPEEVIGLGEVLSHFAYTPNVCEKISKGHFHALPLARVCFLLSTLCAHHSTRYRTDLFSLSVSYPDLINIS